MDITVTEIMELADMHADSKITEGTPAELLPRNLLQHRMQQICTDVFVLQCQLIEARREVVSLQGQLEAVGAGGVGAAPWCEGCTPENCSGCQTSGFVPAAQLQPVAWAIFAENGNCRMWTQNKGHADVAAKDTGLPLTALYAAPQPAAQEQPVALLVRKKSWLDGQWECAPKGFGNYGTQWADERMWVYAAPQPPAQALDALKQVCAIAVSAAKTNSRDIADWREDMDRIAAIAAQQGGANG